MKIRDIGEFGLIGRLKKRVKKGKGVVAGIGDDAAVIASAKEGFYDLLTCDMLVQDVHFTLQDASPFDMGWKAVGASISDIAAMGGIPKFAVVSLGLTGKEDVRFCDELYSGMEKISGKFGLSIVGGDTVSSPKAVTISVAMTGEVEKDRCVYRSGAGKGDAVFVTGTLGGSILRKQFSFTPRVKEARFLTENFKITSMMDITDGLISDMEKIAESSDVGALLFADKIPVSADAKKIKGEKTPLERALSDGEDFELLFTVPRMEAADLVKKFAKKFRTPLSLIGSTTPEKGVRVINSDGAIFEPRVKGYDHFQRCS